MGAGKAQLCCPESPEFALQPILGKSTSVVVASSTKEENVSSDMSMLFFVSEVVSMRNYLSIKRD